MDGVKFLQTFHPHGPWAVSAICPKTGRIENKCFTKQQVEHLRCWIQDRNGVKNLYFSPGRPATDANVRLTKETTAFVNWLQLDIDIAE